MVSHSKVNQISIDKGIHCSCISSEMIRCIFILCLLPLFLFIQSIHANAMYAYVAKSKLVYEITSVSALTTGYVIEGWSFINESQHYMDIGDIDGKLSLRSNQGTVEVPITFQSNDMTYLMKMDGRRRCGNLEFYQPANECYYDYKNVKFRAVIPFDQLADNTNYTIQLQLHAKKTNKKHGLDIYFVSTDSLVSKHNGRTISIKAALDQTYFYVNHNFVLARKSASKTSGVHQEAASCSLIYGNDLYFEPYSQYFQIKEVKLVSQVSWYQILTKHKYCSSGGLHYVEEGGSNVTWIPSSFLEYNGNPATIEVRKENTPPVVVVTNPTIYVGDTSFRSEDYVDAYDLEDGVLVPVKGIGNLNINKIGTYMQEYSAYDSLGLRTSKIMIIRVIEKPANTPPKIIAKNHTIYQYSIFDELKGVTAYDLEEGDITNRVSSLHEIDSSILGKQDLCLYVIDSGGLDNQVCVVITVIPNPKYSATTTLRFVDHNNLFYREFVPTLWQDKQMTLINAINQRTPLIKATLH